MRKAVTITCALAAVLLSFTVLHTPAFARYAAIVLDADTGRVLHAANPDTRNYPASLTKMMTLYLVFDALESQTMPRSGSRSIWAERRRSSRV